MGDDLSTQILNQTTESISKLFDLSTRIDERVKTLQNRETDLKESMASTKKDIEAINLKLVLIQDKYEDDDINKQLQQCQMALVEIDKKLNNTLVDFDRRIATVESSQQGSENRWDKIITFAIQLVWVIIAAWVLATLGLQSPP